MGLEGAVRHYELKADQLAQLSENAKAVYREELAAHSNRLLNEAVSQFMTVIAMSI